MRKMHPLLLSFRFVSINKPKLILNSQNCHLPKPAISKYTNTQTMSAKFLLPGLLAMAAFFISAGTCAQTATVKTATTAEHPAANVSTNSDNKRVLSNEAATAILNFESHRANKTEAQLKAEQSILMKTFCLNHPAYQSAAPGASKASIDAAESWKKNYPAEYAAYLQIFHFKQ
jgi:hypothetical protein